MKRTIPKSQRKKYQRADGTFERKVKDETGKYGSVYANSSEELSEKVREINKQIDSGIKVSDKTTVEEWARIWLRQYKAKLRDNTVSMYRIMYNAHIGPLIGAMQLKEVKPVNITEAMNNCLKWEIKNKKGVTVKSGESSESLQKKVLITLNQLFQTAVENRIIAYNPCIGIKIVKRQPEVKIKTLSEEQQAEIIEKSKLTRVYLFVSLGLYCGLRREESLALRWADVEWDKQEIKILQTVTFQSNRAIVSPLTKSASGKRNIPILPPMLDILNGINPKHKNIAKIPVKVRVKGKYEIQETESIYLCPGKSGEVMTQSSYKRAWEVITRRVDFHVTSHMFRHTYCTMLHKAGIDMRTAQYLLGDNDLKTVSQIYTHIEKEQTEDAKNKLLKLFENKKSTTN